MTLQVRGGGPIGTITVVSDSVGNVRGCVTEPRVPLVEKYPGKLDVGATVGTDGTLTVIRDLQMKEPYIGSTQLVSGEIGDDVTAYFAQSEQTPTACALGVLVDRDQSVKVAGGYLLQLLPGAPDEVIDALEKGISRAGAVTPMLEAGMTPEDILGQVCGSLGVAFLETTEVAPGRAGGRFRFPGRGGRRRLSRRGGRGQARPPSKREARKGAQASP